MLDELISFVKANVPDIGYSDDEIERYVKWHVAKGYAVVCTEQGRIAGVCFMWRIADPRSIGDFPETEAGDFIFCHLAIAARDMFARGVEGMMKRFPGAKYLCYRRELKGDPRLRIWRLKDGKQGS